MEAVSTGKAGSPRVAVPHLTRWRAWHAFVVVAFWGMGWLGDWQLHRALAGNSLSWAYTFEWPIFAVMGAIFWAKTIRDEFRLRSGAANEPGHPAAAGAAAGQLAPADGGPGSAAGVADQAAAARDAHLARLNEAVRGHGRWHGLR